MGLLVAAFIPRTAPTGGSTAQSADSVAVESPNYELSNFTALGDSYTGGSGEDSGADGRWPALVAKQLGTTYSVEGLGGSGYNTVGPTGRNFAELPGTIRPTTDVIVIFGSRNDTGNSYNAVRAAVDSTLDGLGQSKRDTYSRNRPRLCGGDGHRGHA